ncbi:hypothetical protein M378DRAFT_162300 [Amanita muscaria Koide BX008]|uniref:Uncharacterized protein n=1 Tax=Amanita muscaria (strain Koide BX008) TaxID=946122 RepID=A0A0C2X998_AMAMK|nr:hypothetical protein M378DRAFT_162300 [Amanita muscaria Koide BX008]
MRSKSILRPEKPRLSTTSTIQIYSDVNSRIKRHLNLRKGCIRLGVKPHGPNSPTGG